MKKLSNIREKIAIGLVEVTKPYYVRWFKKKQVAWNQSTDSLRRFPKGTLGQTLGDFLERKKFNLIPKLEDHDVLHVLLNYKTTLSGEIKMQFFLIGNRKKSIYALFTALVGIVLVPEKIKAFLKEFTKGRRCASISKWNFEHLLAEPLEMLQQQVFGQRLKGQPIRF